MFDCLFISPENCLTSIIGDVFHYENQKWIMLACENKNVILYDITAGSVTILKQLTSYPLSVRAFEDPGVLILGDNVDGDVFIFKFDPLSLSFSEYLTITTGKFSDKILYMEILDDKTLWLQFTNSNLFIEFLPCLNDITVCRTCKRTFHFNIIDENDES